MEGVVALFVILGIAGYVTKPKEKTFKSYLKKIMKDESFDSLLEKIVFKRVLSSFVFNDNNCIVKDYGLFNIGILTFDSEQFYFIGFLNTWWQIPYKQFE